MKAGARNQLKGIVSEVKKGEMMSKVRVEIARDVSVSSVMTAESLEELGLEVGDEVRVLIKAVNVLLVRE